ncbi:MAG: hypothetical protein IKV00_02805, partial [Clostridia bacterium]|nr:hypothetical protein [Clostridia bacterium]
LVSVDNCLLFVLDHDVFHLSKNKISAENTVPVGEIRFRAQQKRCERRYPDTEFASLETL